MLLMDKKHMIFLILIGIFLFGNLNSSNSGHQSKKNIGISKIYIENIYMTGIIKIYLGKILY